MTRRFWFGTVVTLGFLFLFLWKLDFGQTGKQLQGANYVYFIPAVLVYFCALALRCLRWRFLLLHLKPVSVAGLYPVVAIGYMANNVLPVRLGELVRSHFLGEKEKISKASVLSTIGVERVLDGLTLLLFAGMVWPFLPRTGVLRAGGADLSVAWVAASVAVGAVFVAAFVVLFLLAAYPGLGARLARLLPLVFPRSIRGKMEGLVYLLIDGLGALRSPRVLVLISLLSVPVWLTEAAVYYILAFAFNLEQPFQVILLVTATSNLATSIPSSIGGIGPFEVVAKSTLVAFGVGAEVAAAYTFSVHILALWLPVNILGLLFLWKENVSISQFTRSQRVEIPGGVAGRAPLPKAAAGEGEDE